MTNITSAKTSAWQQAGFPYGFRFRKPSEVFFSICQAMTERSIAIDHYDHQIDTEQLNSQRMEIRAIRGYGPLDCNRLKNKHNWNPYYHYDGPRYMWHFLNERIMDIASHYCDPDKAYDFENYPELENWTPESLEDKLKDKYVKLSKLCNKEKYLMFLYHVLNLCSVRRVGVADSVISGYMRGYTGDYFSSSFLNQAMSLLKRMLFTRTDFRGHAFEVVCNHLALYGILQYKCSFLTWLDDERPCDITFYAYADDIFEKFDSTGNSNIKPNSWFCAGKADKFETFDGQKIAALDLKFPDSELPHPHLLERNQIFRTGFSLKCFNNSRGRMCYGYAVRDQRNYLNFLER